MRLEFLTLPLMFIGGPVMGQGLAPDLPSVPAAYANPTLPNHFLINPPGPFQSVVFHDNEPGFNRVTDAGATLGRVLFYDRLLSRNGTVSCASCHVQEHGFSDPRVLSEGFMGGTTRRHSMGLSNARYYRPGDFFWDIRAGSLESQVLMPIQDPVEMGMSLPEMVDVISERDFYGPLFEDAFGDDTVTSQRAGRALAQFVRSMQSYRSRYDSARAQVGDPGQPFPGFSQQENRGKQIFFAPPPQGAGCAQCHTSDAFVNDQNGPMNNGLDAISTTDHGAFETTGNPQDRGAFKVPSLRNIAQTAPYMHDGRFATLNEVVEFYNSGVQAHPNLDPRLRRPGGQPLRLNLNQNDRNALVAFMGTLTDNVLLNDPKFSDPFPETLGDTYCSPAQANSTGFPARILADGIPLAQANDLTLHAENLPPNQFAMFIAGSSQDMVFFPGGSQGHLCVGGGGQGYLGRIASSLQDSGPAGLISYTLDLQNIPIAVAPYTIAIANGTTWNFQTWYRDNGGANNFSDAVSVFLF